MRWKRLIKCAGGLRCADIVVPDEIPGYPAATIYVEYTCGGCGTHYAWNSATKRRQTIKTLSAEGGGGVVLAPGQTETFFFKSKGS